MRKILVLAYQFPPSMASGTFRTLGFVRNLSDENTNISVISGSRYLKDNVDNTLLEKIPKTVTVVHAKTIDIFKVWDNIKKILFKRKQSNQNNVSKTSLQSNTSLTLNSIYHHFIENLTMLLKTPDNALGWLVPVLIKAIKMVKPDVIYSSGPPFTSHILGLLLKKRWKCPLICDFRDPWIDNPFQIHRSGYVYKWNKKLEAIVVGGCDLVIANNNVMAEAFLLRYPNIRDKLIVITNGFDAESIETLQGPIKTKNNNKLTLVHMGALYGKRNPLVFLQALSKAVCEDNHADFNVKLVGRNEAFGGKSLHQYIIELGLQNHVNICDQVSHSEAVEEMKASDCLLLFAQGTDIQVPAKLFEYMSLGKPIFAICEDRSATQDILLEMEGLIYEARNNIESVDNVLKVVISDYYSGKLFSHSAGDNKKYNRVLQAEVLSREIDNLIQKSKGT